ncbi:uncharacterized protein FA14DRAFT_160616 [Meira miltonrushii]|uniref:Uncharacterized protein n=1 Tax=Meira miltonrushii TaxID=1280837 RepID=A0A316VDC6_9BASI|nr:uncharacterized protein FA14DRAFT_160616 [Meira miltonrushii]PWN35490.1 hypothetical protein FA14DRAFT_160616 [Meira miltonrushii]
MQKYEKQLSDHHSRNGAELNENQDGRTHELESKIIKHSQKLSKQYASINELKSGVKVAGKKDVDHLRARNKLAPGYS